MRFKSHDHEIELIETVGELRAAIADLPDHTPIRFVDPDTEWLMRLSPAIAPDTNFGHEDGGRMVFPTQEYWMHPEEDTKPFDEAEK